MSEDDNMLVALESRKLIAMEKQLRKAIEEFVALPSITTMRHLNGVWAKTWRLLESAKPGSAA